MSAKFPRMEKSPAHNVRLLSFPQMGKVHSTPKKIPHQRCLQPLLGKEQEPYEDPPKFRKLILGTEHKVWKDSFDIKGIIIYSGRTLFFKLRASLGPEHKTCKNLF